MTWTSLLSWVPSWQSWADPAWVKTTLLKLIGGLLTPQKGTVTFAGQKVDTSDSAALYKIRRSMGMLFQFGALFTDMTVFDNVAFPS